MRVSCNRTCGRLHFAPPRLAPDPSLFVDAPAFVLEVLVDMRGPPRFLRLEKAMRRREREQSGAGEVRHCAQTRERDGVVERLKRAAQSLDRLRRLVDMDDARGDREARAEPLGRPAKPRIERFGLTLRQRLGRLGAIAHEIGTGVAQDLGPRLRHRSRDAVDRRVEEPRQRHIGRIDRLALAFPFGLNPRHERPARRRKSVAAGRPRDAAVESQGVPAAFDLADLDRPIETLDRGLPHMRLRGAHRVLAPLSRKGRRKTPVSRRAMRERGRG